MRDEPPDNDLRTIWQNQPTEPSVITMEKIRQKTQELHAKTRRTVLKGITVSLSMAGLCGYGIAAGDSPVVRAAFAIAIAWSMAGQYFVNRGMWSATMPEPTPLSTGLESYRREVERRRQLSSQFLLWSLGPVVLALAAWTVPLVNLAIRNGMLRNTIPFLTLLGIWFVSMFVIRMRDQRELQREIEELNATERDNK